MLKGILFKPATGTGPFPAVVISHGKGGTARGDSANVARTRVGWGLSRGGSWGRIRRTSAPLRTRRQA